MPSWPAVFQIGEAHHMGRGLALGVAAAELAVLVDALDLGGLQRLRAGIVQLALEPDKAALGWPASCPAQRAAGPAALASSATRSRSTSWRHGPGRGHGHAGGQQTAVAILDAAAAGRQLQGGAVALPRPGSERSPRPRPARRRRGPSRPAKAKPTPATKQARAPDRRLHCSAAGCWHSSAVGADSALRRNSFMVRKRQRPQAQPTGCPGSRPG